MKIMLVGHQVLHENCTVARVVIGAYIQGRILSQGATGRFEILEQMTRQDQEERPFFLLRSMRKSNYDMLEESLLTK
ncbi:hypothetical protein BofuT4_uP160180.1 [Botrytis cinerea T4]|uniref:Uncharacterized protein n=1 Tax=Botryotinia fuckeliana (strain T4) TaxID=999810 RepID=G2YTG9_BOTF4|nr:hypothetical protein BofuT4_uP160180.1 [Botrytis cinerea T4]